MTEQTNELVAIVIGAGAVLSALLAVFRKVLMELYHIKEELGQNTTDTKAIHKMQVDQAELDFLRRFKAAFDTIAHPEWVEEMNKILNGRKLRASDSALVQEMKKKFEKTEN